MELHINGKKFCDVVSVSPSGDKDVVMQFGSLKPIESKSILNIIVEELPTVGLGMKMELVEAESRREISYKDSFQNGKDCVIQASVC
jgi:hypothetical protein